MKLTPGFEKTKKIAFPSDPGVLAFRIIFKVSNPAINVEFMVSAGYFDCATM